MLYLLSRKVGNKINKMLKEKKCGDMYCLVKQPLRATAAKFILAMIAIVLIADILGFIAWQVSGQVPADDMFIGTITSKVVKMIVK